MGLNININQRSVKYAIFQEKLSSRAQELYWRIICTLVVKAMCVVVVMTRQFIPSETVLRQTRTDQKMQRTLNMSGKTKKSTSKKM